MALRFCRMQKTHLKPAIVTTHCFTVERAQSALAFDPDCMETTRRNPPEAYAPLPRFQP
jgi:hypothetical protein